MDIAFNPRENGACPFCRRGASCVMRKKITDSLNDVGNEDGLRMEIVIYACPHFVEKA